MVVSRGSNHIFVFNFSQKTISIDLPNLQKPNIIFNETEEEARFEGERLLIGPLNCIML
jgi:hypothetical protein